MCAGAILASANTCATVLYMALPLSFRWPQEFVARIDIARGDIPRSAFVRRAVEGVLDRSGVPDGTSYHLHVQQANVLNGLREAHERLQRDEQEVVRRVAAAREFGVTWQSIGSVLGVSKQSAWERYGRNDPDPIRSQPPAGDDV
jgi:hypothetical protein